MSDLLAVIVIKGLQSILFGAVAAVVIITAGLIAWWLNSEGRW